MYDMLLLAFQTDTTRVSTLMLAGDGSNRTLPGDRRQGWAPPPLAPPEQPGDGRQDPEDRPVPRGAFARFAQQLAETKEGEGTLLDNSLILFGGGISDGNAQPREPADPDGRACERNGRDGTAVAVAEETPLCNLYLSMLGPVLTAKWKALATAPAHCPA